MNEGEDYSLSPQKGDKMQKKRSITSLWKNSNSPQASEFDDLPPQSTNPPATTQDRRKSPPNIDSIYRKSSRGSSDNFDRHNSHDSDDGEGENVPNETVELFTRFGEWISAGTHDDLEYRDASSQLSKLHHADSDNLDGGMVLSPTGTSVEGENWWQSIRGFMNSDQPDADAAAGSSLLDDDQSLDDMLTQFMEWIKMNQGESASGNDEGTTAEESESSEQQNKGKVTESSKTHEIQPHDNTKVNTKRVPPAPHGSPTVSESSLKSDNSFSVPMPTADPLNKDSVVPTGVGWARYQAWQESNTDEAKRFRKWLQKRQTERRPSRSRMKTSRTPHRKYSNSSLDSGNSFQSSMERDSNSSVTGDSYGSSYDSVKRDRVNTDGDSGGGSRGGSGSREDTGDAEEAASPPLDNESPKNVANNDKNEGEGLSFDKFFSIDTSAIESMFTSKPTETTDKHAEPSEDIFDQLGDWVRDTMSFASPLIKDGRSRSSSGSSMHEDNHLHHTNFEVWNPIHERREEGDEVPTAPMRPISPNPPMESNRRRKNSDKQNSFIDLDWGQKVGEWVSEQTNEFETRRASVQADAEDISNTLKKSLFGLLSTDSENVVEGVQVGEGVNVGMPPRAVSADRRKPLNSKPNTASTTGVVTEGGDGLFDDDDFDIDDVNQAASTFHTSADEFDDINTPFSETPPATPSVQSPVHLTPHSQSSQGSAGKPYTETSRQDRTGVRNLLL